MAMKRCKLLHIQGKRFQEDGGQIFSDTVRTPFVNVE
jgi:hypothetical protein